MPRTMIAPFRTFADVLERLGVPAERVRFDIKPGRSTVHDWSKTNDGLFELIDGFLVEKTYGIQESFLAVEVGVAIVKYLEKVDLGFVLGVSGAWEILSGQVRSPDVSFISWSKCPGHTIPDEDVPKLVPDLVVEVLSPKNFRKEIARKLREYFTAGTTLVWIIHPKKRQAVVYTSPDQSVTVAEGDHLDGGTVLPGFKLELKKLFAKLK